MRLAFGHAGKMVPFAGWSMPIQVYIGKSMFERNLDAKDCCQQMYSATMLISLC